VQELAITYTPTPGLIGIGATQKQAKPAEGRKRKTDFRRSTYGAWQTFRFLTVCAMEALLSVFSAAVTNAASLQAEALCPVGIARLLERNCGRLCFEQDVQKSPGSFREKK
jgi:hypothetical protein